jgi:hypothetical protein
MINVDHNPESPRTHPHLILHSSLSLSTSWQINLSSDAYPTSKVLCDLRALSIVPVCAGEMLGDDDDTAGSVDCLLFPSIFTGRGSVHC